MYPSGFGKIILPIILEDIIIDTGNEAGYCRLTSPYIDLFRAKFPKINLIIKTKHELLSENECKFRFNKSVVFKSKIGFRSGKIPPNWHNSINIGINSIIQFTSIIFPTDIKNSKSKYICCHSK
ncbi:hypothetical protein LCGC14_1921370 [marine sediment metagenome]|uniref:Uncharacterized protein n=1 Tax=marine sediment metagenome TaxID=412755 RepID=A0A0F9GE55_9ZZZZ